MTLDVTDSMYIIVTLYLRDYDVPVGFAFCLLTEPCATCGGFFCLH